MVDVKRLRSLSPRGSLIAAVAATTIFTASTAQAQSSWAHAGAPTTRASQLVLAGYYKNKTNWGAVGAGVAVGIILGSQLNKSSGKSYTSKKSYSSKPKRRSEPERKQARINCDGGDVEDGECVCPDGAERKKLGKRSYSCEVQKADADFAPDEILATINPSAADSLEQDIGQDLQLDIRERYVNSLLNERVVLFKIKDDRNVESVLSRLRADGRVNEAQLNYYYRQQAGATANAPDERTQYALAKIDLQDAQAVSRGRGVLIGLIDGFVNSRNPALQTTLTGLLDSTNQKNVEPDPHATAIAGVMNANGDLRGVAPEARILSIRAVRKLGGVADSFSINQAIHLAVLQNARVLLLPLLSRHDPLAERIIKIAALRQVIIVAPAGNNGPDAGPAYPAAYSDVISVTATDAEDQLYGNANQGSYIGVAAPGVQIMVLSDNAKYELKSGTSYAAAHVAGVAALMLGYDPQLTVDRIRRTLMETATDLGEPGKDKKFGAGRINASASLDQLKQSGPRQMVVPAALPVATAPPPSPQQGQWQGNQYYAAPPPQGPAPWPQNAAPPQPQGQSYGVAVPPQQQQRGGLLCPSSGAAATADNSNNVVRLTPLRLLLRRSRNSSSKGRATMSQLRCRRSNSSNSVVRLTPLRLLLRRSRQCQLGSKGTGNMRRPLVPAHPRFRTAPPTRDRRARCRWALHQCRTTEARSLNRGAGSSLTREPAKGAKLA